MSTIASSEGGISKWKVTDMQRVGRKVLGHWLYNSWIFLLTIYALFADDVRLAATSLPADPVFFSLSCVAMFFFALELVVASLVRDEYWMGFYFWLDLLATVSMISDIGWAWEEILGTDQSSTSSGVTKSTQLARAARASRAGTRAGRIIRMVRIVRLIRLVKIYKITQEKNAENQHSSSKLLYRSYVTYRGGSDAIFIPSEEQVSVPVSSNEELSLSQSMDLDPLVDHPLDPDPHPSAILIGSTRTSTMFEFGRLSGPKQIPIPEEIPENIESKASEEGNSNLPPLEESNVGHRLSEITTKRVILLVLGMMFVLPLFSNSMYVEENTSYVYGLKVLDRVSETDSLDIVWDNFLEQHEHLFTPVIFVEVLGRKTWQKVDPQDLRSVEQQIATMDQTQGSRYYVSPT
jgi:hypothetical protein